MPSTVSNGFLPSASAPSTRQEHTRRPSRVTEHAPQSPVPQPFLGPCQANLVAQTHPARVSRGSHRYSTSSPFTVVFTWIMMTASARSYAIFAARFAQAHPPHGCETSIVPRLSSIGLHAAEAAAASASSRSLIQCGSDNGLEQRLQPAARLVLLRRETRVPR